MHEYVDGQMQANVGVNNSGNVNSRVLLTCVKTATSAKKYLES